MSPQNTTPNWHSYIDTGNSADIVKSTTVAQAIGNKIDAINGQATELALDTSSTLDGMTVEEVLARLRTLHDTLASLNDSAPLSGSAGLVSEDHPGIGLHTRGSDNAVLYGDGINGWRPLALTSDLQNESQRAQQAEGQLVSGTYGMVQGDHPGLGLHTQNNSGAVLYNDAANGWRYLVVGEGNNTDGAVRAAVFSTGANGDRSSPTFIDSDGHYIGLLPAQNPVVNGTLNTDTIASVGGAAVSVSYNNGGRVAFQNDGNMVGYSPSNDVNFALGTESSIVQGPLAINSGKYALTLTPTTIVNGYPRGAIGWTGSNWYPGGDGAIICPSGNMLMESSKNNDPSFTQRFTVNASHDTAVTFPQQFSNDNVQVSAIPQDSGNDHLHVINFFEVNRFRVIISINVWTGSSFTNQITPIPVMFTVTGAK
ncbi:MULTISPECIES: hypothetical protein [unclassified Saccharibacter]|uniref:hypothetical protein n=1 Tax=unclassified Saccharibacter TaxID=2648722 RepID=UPI00132416C0|nr:MULTISPECIES: hypothetical protein [unclassified Saccharibacter]MXV36803.1 hypothetical protein [Saccharibacter sp. EH611]MXV58707.1 hypothetical protein [Saccharibacter sp. EH70]MXV66213.1 hypothetical protein [Saccharibacter sp. EH60]